MNARRAGVPWLLALAAFAAPAWGASDDGGTTGVFASGAGSRPLAMGGAYTAIAEGPWGWSWNPAGLAWQARPAAEMLQGAPDAIGARETQGAIVVPDWRWGALALGYRQYGVDDLDGRDARGLPTGSFSDRESELGLAYGRALTPAFGLGLGIKLRRQSLAGRSGGGVGADVGAALRLDELRGDATGWWRGLVLGSRLANAIRPAVRLDRDEVSEPTIWTAGLAWSRTSRAWRTTLSADLTRVEGAAAHARAGAEFGVPGAFDVRAGWDGVGFSAGTALGWRGMDVGYAWRDNPLGAEQRLSLGWRFGRTVGEARERAAVARERELQQRLQVAFEQDVQRRAQSLLEEARAALAAGDLAGAWDKASVLNAVAPNRPEAADVMARVLAARGAQLERARDWDGALVEYEKARSLAPADPEVAKGAARCREEVDRRTRRDEEQRRLYESVLRRIAAGDPPGARAAMDSLRRTGVGDSTIAPLVTRLDRATASLVDARVEQVQRLVQAGLLDEAAATLERTRPLAPGSPAIARARELIARARPAASAAAETVPAPAATVTEAAKREAEQLYQSGLAAQRAGNEDVAVRSWELAVLKDPRHPRVREVLKREYQTRGLDAFSGGRLAIAVEQWKRALQLDPNDARTRSYLERAQEHLARSAELGVGP